VNSKPTGTGILLTSRATWLIAIKDIVDESYSQIWSRFLCVGPVVRASGFELLI
jgi:hypothetical protein